MIEPRCQDPLCDLLSWYLNGSLDEPQQAAVRAHVEQCEICAKELDELAELAGGFARHGVPQDTTGRSTSTPRRWWIGLAAASILVAAFGLFWLSRETPRGGSPEVFVELNLGAGPLRSVGDNPTVEILPPATHISILLLVPDVSRRYVATLESPDGTRQAVVLFSLDVASGVARIVVDADRCRTPGLYSLVLDDESVEDGPRYRFPFVVE